MSLTLLLHAADLAATRAYYGDALGFTVDDTAQGTITARLGSAELIFTDENLWGSAAGATGTIYVTVPDADAYFATVRDRVIVSWPVQSMPYGSREFGIKDLNGYHIAFRTGAMALRGIRESLSVDDSDLTESAFCNANLERSAFRDVNLRGSSFTDARLADATFIDVDFTNARIEDSKVAGLLIDGIPLDDLLDAYRNRP